MNKSAVVNVDCRGMACPAPILAIAKAAKAHAGVGTTLVIEASDGDFHADLRAWCRSKGAHLADIAETGGTYTARVELEGPYTVSESPPKQFAASPPEPARISTVEVDCRGMTCPAPILEMARARKSARATPTFLRARATDGDFPADLRAWCRSTGAQLLDLSTEGGEHVALVGLNGATAEASPTRAPPAPQGSQTSKPPVATCAEASSVATMEETQAPMVSVEGEPHHVALLQLGNALSKAGDGVIHARVSEDLVEDALPRWSSLMHVGFEVLDTEGPGIQIEAWTGVRPRPGELLESHDTDTPPRENKCTLLVLRNDFESLMAALMVANASAAQGVTTEIYFSFWGVNVLRGERPRVVDDAKLAIRSTPLHALMKWMMPRGPSRQKMSKMHMGGVGLGMMRYFMRRNNVMGIAELLDQAVEMGVTFRVCTMSMGIMGIEERDLMDLANLEFGGVTSFAADARTSAFSMVF